MSKYTLYSMLFKLESSCRMANGQIFQNEVEDPEDDSDPFEFILISLNIQKILHECYYNIKQILTEKYNIKTRGERKAHCINLWEVLGINKGVDPNAKLEKHAIVSKPISIARSIQPAYKVVPNGKPRIGHGRLKLKVKPHLNFGFKHNQ